MEPSLKLETEKLIRSWIQHESEHLSSYLVSGVEDPRINLQSILTRHFLISEVFPSRFHTLMEEECRFAANLNWLNTLGPTLAEPELRAAILHALRTGADNAEGVRIPEFLIGTFRCLPASSDTVHVPNYLEAFLGKVASESTVGVDIETAETFQKIWRSAVGPLSSAGRDKVRVLEPGCGSANEYRFLDSYGIASFIDYTGFDLCEKNVLNARRLFPQIRFEQGNVFDIDSTDKSVDLCFLHDLLEHLSVEGLHRAIAELCRVTRRAICLGFFQMHEGSEHTIRPVDEYHWNTLSMSKVRALFADFGFKARVIHIATFLRERFGCEYTHNRDAYTILVTSDK